jgi:hypothetical protein
MLFEIHCERFIETPIYFHKGLNIVLGDNHSTNSIGKSSLLMIIDYVHGGSSYISKSSGNLEALGHHTFKFKYIFEQKEYYFIRDTENPDIITECDNNYQLIDTITKKYFTNFLLEAYNLKGLNISFRSVVGLFSRVWGRENNNVDKPLQNALKEAEKIGVDNLIKIFQFYSEIEELQRKIKDNKETNNVLNGLFRKNLIPKITKREYQGNKIQISDIENEIQSIKDNLLKLTLNIEELTNQEIINLKTEKQKILDTQALILNKIRRIDINLINNKTVKSRQFSKLSMFFDNANLEKINEIETFHSKIAQILKKDLELSKTRLTNENNLILEGIEKINIKIDNLLKQAKSPTYIIDKVSDMTVNKNSLIELNKYYERKDEAKNDKKDLDLDITTSLQKILVKIQTLINDNLLEFNSEVYSTEKKAPKISLKHNTYEYNHSGNGGTGKSYLDMIIFDLTVLFLTKLPLIIHDSFMFKNIEDAAIEKVMSKYSEFSKQIFISIDGINKFDNEIQKVIISNKIIELNNEKLLFNKDWR